MNWIQAFFFVFLISISAVQGNSETPSMFIGKVTSTTARVRENPSIRGRLLAMPKKGSEYLLQKRDGGWYQIAEGEYQGKYIYTQHLTVSPAHAGGSPVLVSPQSKAQVEKVSPSTPSDTSESRSSSGTFYVGLGLSPFYGRFDLLDKVTDQSGILLTDLQLGADLFLKYRWAALPMESKFQGGWSTVNLQDLPGRPFRRVPVGLWRLELSQKYLNLLPGLHAQGLFGLRKDFFDFSSNPVSIDAYTVVMPRLSMGLEYAFYRGQCSEVSLYGNSLYEFSRSSEQFEIESAWGLSTGLRYKMALDPQEVHSVSAGYRFERLWQNTTFAERTRSEMGLEINFTRKL